MIPSELGDCIIVMMPGIYVSSKMNASEIAKMKKLEKAKALVQHIVDLCLQYWNIASMIEFRHVLDSHAKFLPSVEMSRSYR